MASLNKVMLIGNLTRDPEIKYTPKGTAIADIGLAVMATTLSLVVIFVPVSFMSSVSGRFLYQFGITAAVAVLVSLLVSFTLTPMMSARLLSKETRDPHHARSRGGFYAVLDRAYTARAGRRAIVP